MSACFQEISDKANGTNAVLAMLFVKLVETQSRTQNYMQEKKALIILSTESQLHPMFDLRQNLYLVRV